MSVEIKWLGHASFRIASPEQVIYVDPWKIEDTPHDGDVVFVSHSHYDHCSPEDVDKVAAKAATVVASADTAIQFAGSLAIAPGEKVSIGPIDVVAVPAYNVGKTFHPRENLWCGVVLAIDGKSIYYAGDTDLVPEMGELSGIDVALLPVGGKYTMDAAEAVAACETIDCRAAIPYHWGDIIGSIKDAKRFAGQACCRVHLLQPGQSVTV